ncbi:MAG: hypothetical protein AB7O92_22345 [Acidimicrobiia bacterium]
MTGEVVLSGVHSESREPFDGLIDDTSSLRNVLVPTFPVIAEGLEQRTIDRRECSAQRRYRLGGRHLIGCSDGSSEEVVVDRDTSVQP